MPKFKYFAYTDEGDLVDGEIESSDLESARETLIKRDITPYDIKLIGTSIVNYNISLKKENAPLSEQHIAEFTREVATLLEANIPVDQIFKIISTQLGKKTYKHIAKDILLCLIDGGSLSDALARHGSTFNQEYINVVRVGEKVGKIGPSFKDLADMLERRTEIRTKLRSALIYPSLLIIMAVISTGVIVGTLVPNIAPIFEENNQPIPSGLQFLIDLIDSWPIILAFICCIGIIILFVKRTADNRRDLRITLDKFKLRVPIIGELLVQNNLARFSRTVGSMLKSGVPLIQGLESGYAAIQNDYFKSAFENLTHDVKSGARLSSSITNIEYIPAMVIQMVSIGEETGRLDDMLLRVANIFEKKTQTSIERAMSLLTPILTIIIAAVVGGLIITVMNAVLSINDLAGR
jgi:general secretion pathway protein F